MNVGLLTSQASMNYGGILQAYALKKFIESMGHECTIINYKPEVHDINKHPLHYIISRKNGLNKAFFVLLNYSDFKSRKQKFDMFKNDYLLPNPSISINKYQLESELYKYDIICCGSDQLWNLNQKDNQNKAFMLDFDYSFKSFSYAVSFGDSIKVCSEKLDDSISLIKKFAGISVRELEGQEYLKSKGIESVLSVDPTLLYDSLFWDDLSKLSNKTFLNDYIFCYGYENAYQSYEDFIYNTRLIGKKTGLPVINILMNPSFKQGFTNIYDIGPFDFLNIIKNAKLVCTNSYHGTIFSHHFGTPYCVLYSREYGLDSRKKTLLNLINQEWRAISDINQFDINSFFKDSSIITDKEINLRNESINYLKRIIN